MTGDPVRLKLGFPDGHYLAQLDDSNGDHSKQQFLPSVAWQGSGTILLVEDENELKSMAKAMIYMLGFAVIEASNGKEALEQYQKNAKNIKIVFTDIGMPIMDGHELFRELKNINPKLPVIISSGYVDTAVTLRLEREKIAGLVNKPYTLSQLQEVLMSVVEDTRVGADSLFHV